MVDFAKRTSAQAELQSGSLLQQLVTVQETEKGKETQADKIKGSDSTEQTSAEVEHTVEGGDLPEHTDVAVEGSDLPEHTDVAVEGSDLPEHTGVAVEGSDLPEHTGVAVEGSDLPEHTGVAEGSDLPEHTGVAVEGSDLPEHTGVAVEGSDLPEHTGVAVEGSDLPEHTGVAEEGSDLPEHTSAEVAKSSKEIEAKEELTENVDLKEAEGNECSQPSRSGEHEVPQTAKGKQVDLKEKEPDEKEPKDVSPPPPLPPPFVPKKLSPSWSEPLAKSKLTHPPPIPPHYQKPPLSYRRQMMSSSSRGEDADLTELVSKILFVSETVAKVVSEIQMEIGCGSRQESTSHDEGGAGSFDAYSKVMGPLQFGKNSYMI